MKTRGVVYLAFGAEYDRLASYTVTLSRPFIGCDVAVVTNIPEKKRSKKWSDCENIQFVFVDKKTCKNRQVKIELFKYSPFDETIYLDCDSIVRAAGIERVFDHLVEKDLVFQHHTEWTEGKEYYRLYRDTAKKLGVSVPFRVVLGGFWAFRRSPDVEKFFKMWSSFWEKMGSGRDMPALACALKKSGVDHAVVYKQQENFFSFGIHSSAIVVHRMGKDDLADYYGIPEYRPNKPFDVGNRSQWEKVAFNG